MNHNIKAEILASHAKFRDSVFESQINFEYEHLRTPTLIVVSQERFMDIKRAALGYGITPDTGVFVSVEGNFTLLGMQIAIATGDFKSEYQLW